MRRARFVFLFIFSLLLLNCNSKFSRPEHSVPVLVLWFGSRGLESVQVFSKFGLVSVLGLSNKIGNWLIFKAILDLIRFRFFD